MQFANIENYIRQTRREPTVEQNERVDVEWGQSLNLYYQNRHRCVIFSSVYSATELKNNVLKCLKYEQQEGIVLRQQAAVAHSIKPLEWTVTLHNVVICFVASLTTIRSFALFFCIQFLLSLYCTRNLSLYWSRFAKAKCCQAHHHHRCCAVQNARQFLLVQRRLVLKCAWSV